MYILHRRIKRPRLLVMFLVVALFVTAAAIFGKNFITPSTKIGPTPAAVVSTVKDTKTAPRHFDERLFSFDAPKDWEAVKLPDAPAGAVSWRNTAENKGVRVITLYLDATPPNFAINRVVAVQPMDNRLTVLGDVSENCINFTNPGKQPTGGAGKVEAKWQNVSFLCDTGNYVRNVVGTGSVDGLNTTKLTGPTAGPHTVFFTYTDSSASPNFGIFTAMLQSFRLK